MQPPLYTKDPHCRFMKIKMNEWSKETLNIFIWLKCEHLISIQFTISQQIAINSLCCKVRCVFAIIGRFVGTTAWTNLVISNDIIATRNDYVVGSLWSLKLLKWERYYDPDNRISLKKNMGKEMFVLC